MTDETTKRRARRAEPITKRVAKNGATTYEFRADLGIKPDGTRDRRRFTYSTLREARAEYRRITTEVAAGVHVARAKVTVGEHIEAWLRGRRDVRAVTLEGYRHALKPVVDRPGALPLQQLTKAHVDDLVTWRLTEGRTVGPVLTDAAAAVLAYVARHADGITYSAVIEAYGSTAGKHLDRLRAAGHVTRPRRGVYVATAAATRSQQRRGVSERTVTTTLVQLSAALDDAVEQGLLTRNVAPGPATQDHRRRDANVDPRTGRSLPGTRAGSPPARVLAAHTVRAAAVRGARPGVVVRRPRRRDGGRRCGPSGARIEHRGRRPEVCAVSSGTAGPGRRRSGTAGAEDHAGVRTSGDRCDLPDTGLVAVHEDGSAIRPEWYSDEFARTATAVGVPAIRLHDARHTAASIMLDAGNSVSATAEWLGHDPAMTLRVYGHVYDDALKTAGAALFGDATEAAG